MEPSLRGTKQSLLVFTRLQRDHHSQRTLRERDFVCLCGQAETLSLPPELRLEGHLPEAVYAAVDSGNRDSPETSGSFPHLFR
jgi:hypothetical protein